MRKVYLDYAATTPLHPEIEAIMRPLYQETFGNPSSTHGFGRKAREAVETAREQVASALGCSAGEVIFTSGGTEADNSAIVGTALANRDKGRHIVTTAIEHHAILATCEFLETLGYEVTYVKPKTDGIIQVDEFLQAVRSDTVVASCMWVNNETGAIQPIEPLAAGCHAKGVAFHTDAVQAAGLLPIDMASTEISLLSVSGHKVYGPKGVGALVVKRDTHWTSMLHGGSQERGRRAGTENVASIVGFGAAMQRVQQRRPEIYRHVSQVKQAFLSKVMSETSDVVVQSPADSAPSILSLGFSGVKTELLLMNLDLEGIAASSGSACTAGSLQPSHVLLAMGLNLEQVKSSVRFSFSEQTSVDEAVYAAEAVSRIINRLRK